MNKNQKIALIAGAAVLAIIVFIIPVTTNYSTYQKTTSLRYNRPYQIRSALIWGGCCCSIYLCRIYSSERKRLNPYTPTPLKSGVIIP